VALHFSEAEFDQRKSAVIAELERKGLDGILLFRQESQYYLTGYDTFGYVFFQCVYLGTDGRTFLLTRSADQRQAAMTSTVKDIRIWRDAPDSKPAVDLREILREYGCEGKKLGAEFEAYGLTHRNGKHLEKSLDGFCELVDSSFLVSKIRVVKSAAEIAYVKEAAALADDAWDSAKALIGSGVDEGHILAAMQGAIFEGGGDYPANDFIIGSGVEALMCRYKTGRRTLSQQDQITLEWAGVYRHYHAAMMRTAVVGEVLQAQKDMHAITVEALEAAVAALKPGEPVGNAFDAHAKVFDKNGMKEHRLNACGYSLGSTYAPNWMDWPMLYEGNKTLAEPGMVFFCHMILLNSDLKLAMCPGHTVLVTETGAEPLSRSSLDLLIAD
jgi:Xaa-Pro dipeptidase